jgi:hypothetical protein
MKFDYTVMSDDPILLAENSEDPHQKYGITVNAVDRATADKLVDQHFAKQGLRIYWKEVTHIDDVYVKRR